jgi:hypothetical protein
VAGGMVGDHRRCSRCYRTVRPVKGQIVRLRARRLRSRRGADTARVRAAENGRHGPGRHTQERWDSTPSPARAASRISWNTWEAVPAIYELRSRAWKRACDRRRATTCDHRLHTRARTRNGDGALSQQVLLAPATADAVAGSGRFGDEAAAFSPTRFEAS